MVRKLRECAHERSGRAIEISFGAGIYLPTLAESFTEVVASDLNQAHVYHLHAIAAKYPNLELVRDDILDSRLPAHSFSLALCSEVIEHIADTL